MPALRMGTGQLLRLSGKSSYRFIASGLNDSVPIKISTKPGATTTRVWEGTATKRKSNKDGSKHIYRAVLTLTASPAPPAAPDIEDVIDVEVTVTNSPTETATIDDTIELDGGALPAPENPDLPDDV